MRIGVMDSIFPLRDAWDKFLIHGVALPATIGVSATTAFLCGGVPLLAITGGASLVGVVANEFADTASYLTKKDGKNSELPANHPARIMTEKLAREAGFKVMPKCISSGHSGDNLPYAGATGTMKSSAVIVSSNIHETLSPAELKGVIAHELAHIGHADTKTMLRHESFAKMAKLTNSVLWGTTILSFVGLAAAPSLGTFALGIGGATACNVIKAATSRAFERRADRAAATLTENPWALENALKRLIEMNDLNIFKRKMTIKKGIFSRVMRRIFSTHPEMEYRYGRLQAMSDKLLDMKPELRHLRNRTLEEINNFHPHKREPKNRVITTDYLVKKFTDCMRFVEQLKPANLKSSFTKSHGLLPAVIQEARNGFSAAFNHHIKSPTTQTTSIANIEEVHAPFARHERV